MCCNALSPLGKMTNYISCETNTGCHPDNNQLQENRETNQCHIPIAKQNNRIWPNKRTFISFSLIFFEKFSCNWRCMIVSSIFYTIRIREKKKTIKCLSKYEQIKRRNNDCCRQNKKFCTNWTQDQNKNRQNKAFVAVG